MTEFGGWPYFAIASAVYWAGVAALMWIVALAGATEDNFIEFSVFGVLLYGLLVAIWRPWKRQRKTPEQSSARSRP